MAVIHKSSISPTKAQLLEGIFGEVVTVLGAYRLDDPDGQVGVEALLARTSEGIRQVVFTYRGAPLEGAEEALFSTMEHSTLGRRWVYDGTKDPVAVACFRRALEGQQEQAVEEVWDDGRLVGTREPTVRVSLVPGEPTVDAVPVIATDLDGVPGHAVGPCLRAEWAGGEAVVATLGS